MYRQIVSQCITGKYGVTVSQHLTDSALPDSRVVTASMQLVAQCVLFVQAYYAVVVGPVAQSVKRLPTGWTVRGSNPGEGRDFPHLFRPALRPTQPPVQWVLGLSGG
jgi:hypothetical protein